MILHGYLVVHNTDRLPLYAFSPSAETAIATFIQVKTRAEGYQSWKSWQAGGWRVRAATVVIQDSEVMHPS